MKLVTVAEMRAVEQQADASGLSYAQMMENAGRGLAEIIEEEYGYLSEEGIFALVGKGNNGGDALVALTHLAENGWRCTAYLAANRLEDDLVERFLDTGGELIPAGSNPDQLNNAIESHPLLLDGLLGTSVKLPLRANIQYLLSNLQSLLSDLDSPPILIAVDCPSGLDSDTGAAAPETLPADLTITMAAAKPGFYAFPGAGFIGELRLSEIGDLDSLPAWDEVTRFVVDEQTVVDLLPDRPRNAHKGTFGTVIVVAGSVNYPGAAMLSGKAAYRVGAGLVTLAVPRSIQPMLAGHFPEATWLPLPEEDGFISAEASNLLLSNLQPFDTAQDRRSTTLLIGPGLGLAQTTRQFLDNLFPPTSSSETEFRQFPPVPTSSDEFQRNGVPPVPMVFDADGLKLLAQLTGWPQRLPPNSILTPHPGEMSILTGLDKNEIQADRIAIAERFAKEWGHVVVLKGAFTIVAAPDGQTALIPIATPALARAGTGDVLAGMIAGLRAQGMNAFDAAVAGAFLHGQAGLHAEMTLGSAAVLAGDVLEGITEALNH